MQYVVSEIFDKSTGSTGEAKVFKNIPDVILFVRKNNKNIKVMVGDNPATVERLTWLLGERLATTVLTVESEPQRRYVITAFEPD